MQRPSRARGGALCSRHHCAICGVAFAAARGSAGRVVVMGRACGLGVCGGQSRAPALMVNTRGPARSASIRKSSRCCCLSSRGTSCEAPSGVAALASARGPELDFGATQNPTRISSNLLKAVNPVLQGAYRTVIHWNPGLPVRGSPAKACSEWMLLSRGHPDCVQHGGSTGSAASGEECAWM